MQTTNDNYAVQPAVAEPWYARRLLPGLTAPTLALIGILALAAFLNLYNIDAIGDANLYYTAAVESMLDSWHNFFFVAAEPGATVSIDKPPLGLWVQTASAALFGVNGLAVVLPNILAGLASVAIVYRIVGRRYGAAAGLLAALALAVTPVAVAAQRNNTMDGLLTLTLLLAAWACLRAAETANARYLWAGAALVGLGFEIKMLQAYLVLPALFATWLLGAATTWRRKIVSLVWAGLIVLTISLAWPLAVDLTPADQRPYVGSSETNSVLELALGYNGVARLTGLMAGRGPGAGNRPTGAALPGGLPDEKLTTAAVQLGITPDELAAALSGFPPDLARAAQQLGIAQTELEAALPFLAGSDDAGAGRPAGGGFPAGRLPADNAPGNAVGTVPTGAPGGGGEVGNAGALRFVVAPLSKELSWLLLPALAALLLLTVGHRPRLPLATDWQMALLWGGWLLTGLIFFSVAGFFHAYYLIMLAPPLAVLIGAGSARLWQLATTRGRLAAGLLLATAGATLAYQAFNVAQFGVSLLLPAVGGLIVLVGALLLAGSVRWRPHVRGVGFAAVLLGMLIVPLGWAWQTNQHSSNNTLPSAWGGQIGDGIDGGAFAGRPLSGFGQTVDPDLLALLEANTQDVKYLLATASSMDGAPYVLATGRPVLYMGGFSGADPVVDSDDLAALVAAGDLRYILSGEGPGPGAGMGRQTDVSAWVAATCAPVQVAGRAFATLYDCAGGG